MAVTKATYTATGTWTAAQLATIFQDAFVASGLMTAWHDSFASSGIENRILAVTYDGGATYGTTYYWFQFSTSGAFIHICSTWDGPNNVPSGTQYLDYFSTTTNSTGNHRQLLALTSTSNASLIRYTSGADSTQSWYVLTQGSSSVTFTIPPGSFTVAPFVDMDKVLFHHVLQAYVPTPTASEGLVAFASYGAIRRSYAFGGALVGSTANGSIYNHTVGAYGIVGRTSNDVSSNLQSLAFFNANQATPDLGAGVIVPMGNSTANPAYSANFSPVFTSFPISPYISTPNSAADFGISFHFANNTMVRGDKLIVTASVEEWEILAVANNPTVTAGASPMFLARVV